MLLLLLLLCIICSLLRTILPPPLQLVDTDIPTIFLDTVLFTALNTSSPSKISFRLFERSFALLCSGVIVPTGATAGATAGEIVLAAWWLHILATRLRVSATEWLRKMHVLPHRLRSYRSIVAILSSHSMVTPGQAVLIFGHLAGQPLE